jgi:hypothetical protein
MKNVPVPRLTTLWQTVSAVSELSEIARRRQTYVFSTQGPVTFYLRAEQAEVRVTRWTQPRVEITVFLQAAFGWRVAADQDEAGVYLVARRRPLVGSLARALFEVAIPREAYLDLHLDDGRVVLESISGTLQIPPAGSDLTRLHLDDAE